MFDNIRISTAWEERDQSGLTDRETLDVLGLVVSTAIVAWLLFELTEALFSMYPEGSLLPLLGMIVTLATVAYLLSWVEELTRHVVLYAGTWRYGVSAS